MGKNTKIICTVVPNPTRTRQLRKDGNKVKYSAFSVFLTPRLPDSGILKDYYEIINWFKFATLFSDNSWISVRLAQLTAVNDSYTFKELEGSYKVSSDPGLRSKDYLQGKKNEQYNEKTYYEMGEKIWMKIFQHNTPVKGWLFDEGENKYNKVTQIFTKDEIDVLLENNKQKKAGRTLAGVVEEFSVEARGQLTETLKLNDIAGKQISEDELRLENKENQEFHKKISILADYPHLMRSTGWIFDFEIETDISQLSVDLVKLDLSGIENFIANQADPSLWANFSNEIDFKTPWSYVEKNTFSIRYLDKFKKDYFVINQGFMKVSGDAYNLVACQFDHNQLKRKLLDSDTVESTKIKESIDDRSSDLTSTGIGIKVVKKNKGALSPFEKGVLENPNNLNSSTLVNGKKNDSANIDDYIIFGHNLDTGYRIDVAVSKDDGANFSSFKSLCKRRADYKIDRSPYSDKKDFIDLLAKFEDEPWISESAQAGKSGTLYVDEELSRWNNWSLTCPHIGNYPQDEINVKENYEFNDLELQNIRAFDLTPLRFSRKYKFRIRVVDICGNSPATDDFETVITADYKEYEIILKDDSLLKEVPYKRLEIVNPPELHFTENVFEGKLKNEKGEFIQRKLKAEFHGEDISTFVVRTTIKDNKIIIMHGSNVRSVCPPRITQSFLELHGTVDDLLQDENKRMLVYDKASYENKHTDSEVFKPGEIIPFLTDPIMDSFLVRVDGLNSSSCGSIWNQSNNLYIQRRFSSIALQCIQPTDTYSGKVTANSGALVVELKTGTIVKGTVESFIPDHDKPSFHSDALFKDQNGADVQGKYSQPKELLFISAVQKPIIVTSSGNTEFKPIYNLQGYLRKKTPSNPTSIAFESILYLNNSLPLSTTGEIKIIAKYDEIICDRNTEFGYRVEAGKLLVKSFSNFGEGLSLKVDNNNDPSSLLTGQGFSALQHSFGDTKYRNAKYSIELVSRFKDYFPNENEFSIMGVFNDPLKIDNSKKLESLSIESIIPVFSWEEREDHIVRFHDTFRMYLQGDWYQNGASFKKNAAGDFIKKKNGEFEFEEVEKIAVFFLDNKDTIPDPYEGLVSEFGKDPSVIPKIINNEDERRTKGLTKSLFNTDNFIDGVLAPTEKINPSLLERGESSFATPMQIPVDSQDIKAAIYEVKFDSIKKKFYCDIKLKIYNEKKLYFPFLKFAVARYLKTSIKDETKYDYRFSTVVTTPQVQVFPERKILNPKGNFSITTGAFALDGGDVLRNNYLSKQLEFYLILEKNVEGEFDKLIGDKTDLNSVSCIRLDKPHKDLDVEFLSINDKEVKDKIDALKPTSMYVEEFEFYNVWDSKITEDFRMGSLSANNIEIPDINYNPRNDIRKRLVFTYKIR